MLGGDGLGVCRGMVVGGGGFVSLLMGVVSSVFRCRGRLDLVSGWRVT